MVCVVLRGGYASPQQFPCYTPSKISKNSSCLVTPRAKSISLVTHPQKPVVATAVRGHKEGTPATLPFLAIFSESLDFKAFYVLLILDP